LQAAFALYRDDKGRRRFEHHEKATKTKANLKLMNEGYRQLIEHKSATSADWYKRAMDREKRRLAKQRYRAKLPDGKKDEIKQKDRERKKRMRRTDRSVIGDAMSSVTEQFSLSDNLHQNNGQPLQDNGLIQAGIWPPGSNTLSTNEGGSGFVKTEDCSLLP
jgi:hypothetical protein